MCISKHEASLVWLQVCECCQNIAEQMWAAVVVKLSAYSPSTLTIRVQILLKPTVYFCKNMAGVGPLNKYCLREADRHRERESMMRKREREERRKMLTKPDSLIMNIPSSFCFSFIRVWRWGPKEELEQQFFVWRDVCLATSGMKALWGK